MGARAVKAELGLVIAQDPETAAYDGMPRSVIEAGLADFDSAARENGRAASELYPEVA